MAFDELISQSPQAEAIPEAVLWKRMVLMRLDTAIAWKDQYYTAMYQDEAQSHQKNYQASVISLFTLLKGKLSKKELKDFEVMESWLEKSYNVRQCLSMNYLNSCVDNLVKAIDRIGITKVEIPTADTSTLFKRS